MTPFTWTPYFSNRENRENRETRVSRGFQLSRFSFFGTSKTGKPGKSVFPSFLELAGRKKHAQENACASTAYGGRFFIRTGVDEFQYGR